jgi:hypothetical protein
MFPDIRFRIVSIAEKSMPTESGAGVDTFTLRRVPNVELATRQAETASVAASPGRAMAGSSPNSGEQIFEDLEQGHGLLVGEEFVYSASVAVK